MEKANAVALRIAPALVHPMAPLGCVKYARGTVEHKRRDAFDYMVGVRHMVHGAVQLAPGALPRLRPGMPPEIVLSLGISTRRSTNQTRRHGLADRVLQ